MQEQLNRVLLNDSVANNKISGLEDSDDIRSNISDGLSDCSSRISLSRLSEVNLENVMQRATNAIVSKVVNSGKSFLIL